MVRLGGSTPLLIDTTWEAWCLSPDDTSAPFGTGSLVSGGRRGRNAVGSEVRLLSWVPRKTSLVPIGRPGTLLHLAHVG